MGSSYYRYQKGTLAQFLPRLPAFGLRVERAGFFEFFLS